jgi:hypothetical protein
MTPYKFLISRETQKKINLFLEKLRGGGKPGQFLGNKLAVVELENITDEDLLEMLIQTKRPQIFAESAVSGDGSDWTLEELSILGDVSAAVPVTVYDNGLHQSPEVHLLSFQATLLFTPGALLINGMGHTTADWEDVIRDDDIDVDGFYRLYERRLLPTFLYANQMSIQKNRTAFITVPGIGCGQFAGTFRGWMGAYLKAALVRILEEHGADLDHIKALYYDPYKECRNERQEVNGIQFFVRPLTRGNVHKPQLCTPSHYEENGDDFSGCDLFSIVAWDHVSWPGNDFFVGSRGTDDGVKAAATDSMRALTGHEGVYDSDLYQYKPPQGYSTWGDVVLKNAVHLIVSGNVLIYP